MATSKSTSSKSRAKSKPKSSKADAPPTLEELRAQVSEMLDGLEPDTPIAATVTFQVDPAKEGAFARHIDDLAEATRQLPGLNVFHFHRNKAIQPGSDGVEYLIYEDWQTRDEFRAQWDSAHLKKFQGVVFDLIVAPPDLRFYYGADDVGGIKVPRSGQTRCWDVSGELVDCAGTGQDAEFQAGEPFPDPRFTDNGDGTVTDNLTNLVWLKDADHFGEVTWEQALENAQSLESGHGSLRDGSEAGDWRLCNIRELRSLIDYSEVNPILPAGHPFRNVQSAIYWTSTTLASAPALAWMTTLGIGPAVFDLKVNSSRMWPVRGGHGDEARLAISGQSQCWDAYGNVINGKGSGQDGDLQVGVPFPAPRFIDNRDGTVLDKLTGLVWLKNGNPFGFRTWQQALDDCNGLRDGLQGLTDGSKAGDWRLPNIQEMESIIDYGNFAPSLPLGHPFEDVGPTSYWTSTSVTSAPTQAMFSILGVGPSIFENKEHPFLVWPVRDWRAAG